VVCRRRRLWSNLTRVNVPDELRYTSDHEWVRIEDAGLRLGITAYAADALGDVVFVALPEPGTRVVASAAFSELESTKSVSDVYAPVDGVISEVNTELADSPQRLNEDPYGDGWICLIEPSDPQASQGLLDAEAYRSLISD
jgi:glycine cleavage system H protein